jgi:hypothetical protein
MAEAVTAGADDGGADVAVKRVPELVSEEIARRAGYMLDQSNGTSAEGLEKVVRTAFFEEFWSELERIEAVPLEE